MSWTPEKRRLASEQQKAKLNAKKYDRDKQWPEGVKFSPADAPATAWVQCIMPRLRMDAVRISEHGQEYEICRAMVVLLVIIARGRAEVPFICAVTGMIYHDGW